MAEDTGDRSKFSDAFNELRSAIAAVPDANTPHMEMAEVLRKLEKAKEGNTVLEVALKRKPTAARDWLEWFFYFLLSGQKEKAGVALQKSLDADPKSQVTPCLAGEAYYRQKMYGEAVALFGKAVEANPSDIRIYNWLGICHRFLGQADKAVDSYRRALEIDPADCNVHYNLGRVFQAKGDTQKAKAAYEAALKHNPALKEAGDALAQLGMM